MKAIKHMIKLTQILHNEGGEEGDEWLEKPVLINPDYVQAVQVSKIDRTGPAIIGQEYDKEVTRVHMRDGCFMFVTQSFNEVEKALQ